LIHRLSVLERELVAERSGPACASPLDVPVENGSPSLESQVKNQRLAGLAALAGAAVPN
jgi:hypothetical protein